MKVKMEPKLGQMVKVIKGNGSSQYAVIIKIIDSKFVLIADGSKKKFDHPKKKNILHLQLQDFISQIVLDCLEQTGRITNSKLRFVLNQYLENVKAVETQKGG